jgi:cytochrome oxidase assembly protein ShyY1
LGCGSCSAETHALIAHLIERLAAAPDPLPSPLRSVAHNPAHDEFRRVSLTVTYAALPDAMIYKSCPLKAKHLARFRPFFPMVSMRLGH